MSVPFETATDIEESFRDSGGLSVEWGEVHTWGHLDRPSQDQLEGFAPGVHVGALMLSVPWERVDGIESQDEIRVGGTLYRVGDAPARPLDGAVAKIPLTKSTRK